MNWQKWSFELTYRFRDPPWDTGVTPPELVSLVESGAVRPGRALDLGCGTGTNSIYLAQHGFAVVGVDFARKAIASARSKARRAGVTAEFIVGDVTRLDALRDPFDLILDVGCFHSLQASNRARYVQTLNRLSHPGTTVLLYAFSPRQKGERGHLLRLRNVGITPEQVEQALAPHFALARIEHGMNLGERPSAWFWFTRRASAENASIAQP